MSATKKESLEDILNAVREKETVLKPLPGEEKDKKKNKEEDASKVLTEESATENLAAAVEAEKIKSEKVLLKTNKNIEKMARNFASPLRYFGLKFFAGIFFGLGLAIAALLILCFLYMHKDVRIIQELFGNMILMMKAMAG